MNRSFAISSLSYFCSSSPAFCHLDLEKLPVSTFGATCEDFIVLKSCSRNQISFFLLMAVIQNSPLSLNGRL
jgi:hypothetical protein